MPVTLRILQTLLLIPLYELDENTDILFKADDEEADYPLDDGMETIQLLEEDPEDLNQSPNDIPDWEGDYYLDNNQMTNDLLVNSYFSFIDFKSTDINDLLDEENLLSFNNGSYAGEDDMGDPLDVTIS